MGTNIVETIQSRVELMGMSQAQFAGLVGATPAQMSIFLRDKGSLSIKSLNKSLDLVGVNLDLYNRRVNLAKKVATYLLSKDVTSIDNWTKSDLALFTHEKEITYLFDVKSKKEFDEIAETGIIDIESTFPYFQAMVSYYMSLDASKPTARKAKTALAEICNVPDIDSILASILDFGEKSIDSLQDISPLFRSFRNSAGSLISKQAGAFTLFTKSKTTSLFAKAKDFIHKE